MVVLYILLAIIILLVMVVIHEFGHYIAGKILKFKINEFSVGFGPKLFSKKKKNGEVFSLRLVPLGGFCAFEGEDEECENKETRSFNNEKPWKRIIVLLSGGVFNILSAVIFSFLFILIVGFAVPQVSEVYAIDEAGTVPYCELKQSDEIVAVNGEPINVMHNFEDYTQGLQLGDSVVLTVIRDGEREEITLTVRQITAPDGTKYNGFGFSSARIYESGNVADAFIYCVPFTAKMAWTILGSLFDLITGKIAITSVTGPIGTVSTMASVSAANWRNIFILLPLIAANLGIFNLLPIPALDGSKVVFTVIEWIRGKPINRKVEAYIHSVGLLLLFAFVIIVDIIGLVLR
ncbi:M50 family metallopeptidase [Pumilibacter intestinalis]|uniref:M50 family metallopeptidase n=1 Tax=Pumilibacter intestinalis TaxID=2941511 RepID=UPI00203B8E1D|nr:M50 family metallopeptidase [Pumilibacter intestinalis]